MGAQGPGCAPPMPEGGSEDRGPPSAAGPNQTPPGPRGPEPRTGVGRGGRRQGAGLERPRAGGRRDLRAPYPNPKPRHARPTGRSGSRKHSGPPGRARFAGQGYWCTGTGRLRPGCRPWPARPVERCRAGWALRAPAALRLCPREAQRTEGRGPRRARIRHLRGHVALSHEREWAGGGADRGRAWRGPGREGAETSAPLTPTPSPGMHARPAARGPGNTPGPRAGPGLLARVTGVRGRGAFGRAAGPGRRAPWKGAAGWLDTAHQSEKEAQRRVFKGAWRQPPPSKIIPP
ncbi:unnamed protein product [Rangifer tarandus platyrhynchus]|uniref:Uncharacterized protein n=1 Tax=Rangifer tarandus platyrhynchus TaxID=3082113 RepID=A0ABN8XQQ8_RANTA|nr:unnamed protein product [Rangifer tarandus platyrhynchus]